MHETLEFAEAGGLMAYGVNLSDLFRRSASYVAKILNGANPADLPVERPMKAEFVINLKTAQEIALAIPHERCSSERTRSLNDRNFTWPWRLAIADLPIVELPLENAGRNQQGS
jgi:ABC-type uncharacterized transport system substrate-binding protein